MKTSQKFLGFLIVLNVVQIAVMFYYHASFTETIGVALLASSIFNVVWFLALLTFLQQWKPIFEELKKYWQEMPEEDKRELIRIVGQALKILTKRHAKKDDSFGHLFRWLHSFVS